MSGLHAGARLIKSLVALRAADTAWIWRGLAFGMRVVLKLSNFQRGIVMDALAANEALRPEPKPRSRWRRVVLSLMIAVAVFVGVFEILLPHIMRHDEAYYRLNSWRYPTVPKDDYAYFVEVLLRGWYSDLAETNLSANLASDPAILKIVATKNAWLLDDVLSWQDSYLSRGLAGHVLLQMRRPRDLRKILPRMERSLPLLSSIAQHEQGMEFVTLAEGCTLLTGIPLSEDDHRGGIEFVFQIRRWAEAHNVDLEPVSPEFAEYAAMMMMHVMRKNAPVSPLGSTPRE